MKRAIVINCSTRHYNLGARKLCGWLAGQGYEALYSDGAPKSLEADLVALSAIFSWHAPLAREIALQAKGRAEVWCGGPGMAALAAWWQRETGLSCTVGLDWRFERQRGDYRMTFASRGCPVNCWFCLTPECFILTAEGPKPISQVQVGELVLTHKGRYRRVTATMSRPYDGPTVQLRSSAVSGLFPTVLTLEHPVWMRHVSSRTGGQRLTTFKWIEAGNVKPEYSRYSRDVFVFPRTQEEAMPDGDVAPNLEEFVLDREAMTLLGWYLAEGYVSKTPQRGYHRVVFCLGHSEREKSYADEIVRAAVAHGFKAHVFHLKIGIRVYIENVRFANWLVNEIGTGASEKIIPFWVRRLPANLLIPLIEAWCKGDGWFQVKKGTDTWKITTVSLSLALGLYELVLKLGNVATINRHHLNTTIQGRTVNCKAAYTVIFHPPRQSKTNVMSDTKCVYFRVKENKPGWYQGLVYNLEVEDDNSYCTPAFALHNCTVPRIEGTTFTLDWDFQPAPVLCDNNLSALPLDFQRHIVRRYRESGVKLLDANSGFEPRTFTEEIYRLWQPILQRPAVWRFAFDGWEEAEAVERMMRILKDVPARRKQVYVLAGNEPIVECYKRAMKVIEWGGEPFCQMFRPLNYLGGPLRTRYDWTQQLGQDFCRYFNRHVWRKVAITDYSNRKGEAPPFREILAGV